MKSSFIFRNAEVKTINNSSKKIGQKGMSIIMLYEVKP